MEAKDLVLEINPELLEGNENNFQIGNVKFIVTPPIDEDYWQFRVKVHDDQAIVGFPKIMTTGIGFAKEDEWNLNLPYKNSKAEEIFEWIKKNKRYASIPDELCIKAIKMIQKAAKEMEKVEREMENVIARSVVPALFEEDGKELSKKEFKERCYVQRASRCARYVTGEMSKVRKFCLYFDQGGRDYFGYNFKVKMYARTTTEALERFHSMLRRYALGEENPAAEWNDEEFYVSLPEEGKITGFKIALSF
jgi:hypothetical protein